MKIASTLRLLRHPLERFSDDPEVIEARLRAPTGRGERISIAITIGVVIGMVILSDEAGGIPWDYRIYIFTADGIFDGYFYPYWFLPLFQAFAWLPPLTGYFIWGLVNIAGVWFACRVFGGNPTATLTGYQMLYMLGNGQIVGLMAFGLALFWWGMSRQRWGMAGVGIVLAAAKFQSGLLFLGALWALFPAAARIKIKTLFIPVLVVGFSFVLYPNWPLEVWEMSQSSFLDLRGNISLWRWLGPAALIFWIAVFLPRVDTARRLVLIYSAAFLAMPYIQHYDMLMLYALPVAWPYVVLGNLGYLFAAFSFSALQILWVVPLAIYIGALAPALRERR